MMLADSLEAAVRSIDEPDAAQIGGLINEIIRQKMDENQLDESCLTIGDLETIRQTFFEIMLSAIHSRPKYPTRESIHELEGNSRNHQSKITLTPENIPEREPDKSPDVVIVSGESRGKAETPLESKNAEKKRKPAKKKSAKPPL